MLQRDCRRLAGMATNPLPKPFPLVRGKGWGWGLRYCITQIGIIPLLGRVLYIGLSGESLCGLFFGFFLGDDFYGEGGFDFPVEADFHFVGA